MTYTYQYFRPMVTLDLALFRLGAGGIEILLIERGHPPFVGQWALPGGHLDESEPLEEGARRELTEETGLTAGSLWTVGVFGDPGRDPRGRVVTVAYAGVISAAASTPQAADDAQDAAWHPIDRLPSLAFDHDQVVAAAIASLHHRRTGIPPAEPAFPDLPTGEGEAFSAALS